MSLNNQGDDPILLSEGSMTERSRGTYGGRQKWLGKGKPINNNIISDLNTNSIRNSTGPLKSKVSGIGIRSFLNSIGASTGDHIEIMKKEADEVAILRKEYDAARSMVQQKEKVINGLFEQLNELNVIQAHKKTDGLHATNKLSRLQNKADSVQNNLDEEMAEKKVYKHMIQRLNQEVQIAKKETSEKEFKLKEINNDISNATSTLLLAKQEKTIAEVAQKKINKELMDTRDENLKTIQELYIALDQTKQKSKISEQRELSRNKVFQEATGREISTKESIKLRKQSDMQKEHYSEIQKGLSETEIRLQQLEEDYYKLSEAAGTTDVDNIISKYLSRENTFEALKKEYSDAETKMRQLREKNDKLKETITNLRGTGTHARGIYQEMEETADELKEIEKNGINIMEKCNRANVVLDSFRSSMLKNYAKLLTVREIIELDGHNKIDNNKINELTTPELVHLVEQKLSRVIEAINREKAEHELHRGDSTIGHDIIGNNTNLNDKNVSLRQPGPSESEEHFILRIASLDTSVSNVRVQPKLKDIKTSNYNDNNTIEKDDNNIINNNNMNTNEINNLIHTSGYDVNNNINNIEEDRIIDRETRKKLANMMFTRGKRMKKKN